MSTADHGHTVLYRAGFRPVGVLPSDPGYAGRARVFGLVSPGGDSGEVMFAPARRQQDGGPETVQPSDVGRYQAIPLAPGAEIRVTAPIANDGVTDWIHGILVSPDRFTALYRESEAKYGHFLDRGHMFQLWFDGSGRIIRMLQYFSP